MPKRLDLVGAALEIDALTGTNVDTEQPDLGRLGAELARLWERAETQDDATHDAKFKVVANLAGSTRLVAARAKRAEGAIADEAAERVADELTAEPTDPPPPGNLMRNQSESSYRSLYRICCLESVYRIRLAAAQELGAGGDSAFSALEALQTDEAPRGALREARDAQSRDWRSLRTDADGERQLTLRGWLLPRLVESVGEGERRTDVRSCLDDWLERVGTQTGQMMPLALEAALAQGFKHAANCRPTHPTQNAGTRTFLAGRATEMLKNARFWYSRLTLLHALCLWRLSGLSDASDALGEAPDFTREVEHWLRHRKSADEHPFVWHAAELVVEALRTGEPGRYLWIDESGVVTMVGSRATRPHFRHQQLWIPPSTGWMCLDRRAQQLVADILILLNLAERGAIVEHAGRSERTAPYERQQRLENINSNELPPCITQGRLEHLHPSRIVGTAELTSPGAACREDCPVDLCPYPSRGEQPYRAELSEAFCRNQRALLRRRNRLGSPAPWQDARRRELIKFWTEMEQRARV